MIERSGGETMVKSEILELLKEGVSNGDKPLDDKLEVLADILEGMSFLELERLKEVIQILLEKY